MHMFMYYVRVYMHTRITRMFAYSFWGCAFLLIVSLVGTVKSSCTETLDRRDRRNTQVVKMYSFAVNIRLKLHDYTHIHSITHGLFSKQCNV
jgi:predicted membrane chloride channel (bestrophin family)